MRKKTNKAIEDITETCCKYMESDAGKEKVLNPPGHKPILKVEWHPNVFQDKVKERVSLYVTEYLKSQDVLDRFQKIKDETTTFYRKIALDISEMENCWTKEKTNRVGTLSDDNDISTASMIGFVLATSPVWLPLLATGIGLTIAISPILFPVIKFLGREKRKNKIIDEEYSKCISSVREFIQSELQSNQGRVINAFIDKVTTDLLFRQIQTLKKMIEQLTKSRSQIIANVNSLEFLARKIEPIDKSVRELLDYYSNMVN